MQNISIVIPTRNEEKRIGPLLDTLLLYPNIEIIIVDGESTDATREEVTNRNSKLLVTSPGRGGQQHQGALAAEGDTLLFLHCDTELPASFPDFISDTLSIPETAAGAFRLAFDDQNPLYALVAWGANLRAEYLQLPYGDQAIFLKKNIYLQAGGFPNQPLLEDVALIQRLRPFGKIRIHPTPAVTASRRWKKKGLFKTTLLNQFILLAYLCGISPESLYRLYYGKSGC